VDFFLRRLDVYIQKVFYKMKTHRTDYFGFLSTTASILLVFLAFRIYQLIYSLIYPDKNLLSVLGRSLSLVAILILSYLTYKRKTVAA